MDHNAPPKSVPVLREAFLIADSDQTNHGTMNYISRNNSARQGKATHHTDIYVRAIQFVVRTCKIVVIHPE